MSMSVCPHACFLLHSLTLSSTSQNFGLPFTIILLFLSLPDSR